MSMGKLSNAQRAAIQRVLAGHTDLRYGVVTNYDPATHMAMVTIMPEETVSGWLPILVHWVGQSFGLYVGLDIGNQVLLAHVEGDPNAGIIIGRLNSDNEVPPNVPAGEAWAVHTSGSYLKFTNDGKISVHGTVLIQLGNLQNAVKKFVTEAFQTLFNSHTHAHGAIPDQQMDNSHMTTIVKGN